MLLLRTFAIKLEHYCAIVTRILQHRAHHRFPAKTAPTVRGFRTSPRQLPALSHWCQLRQVLECFRWFSGMNWS